MRRGSCHFLVTIVLTSVILFDIFSFFFRPRTRWVFVRSYPHLSHSGFLQVFWRIWLQIWGDMINRSPRASSGQQYLLPCFAWLWNGTGGGKAGQQPIKEQSPVKHRGTYIPPSVPPSILIHSRCHLDMEIWRNSYQEYKLTWMTDI